MTNAYLFLWIPFQALIRNNSEDDLKELLPPSWRIYRLLRRLILGRAYFGLFSFRNPQ